VLGKEISRVSEIEKIVKELKERRPDVSYIIFFYHSVC